MTKRAAIYIRVSTELQAERASPAEQEKDCRALCERKGYVVVEVYSDIERYRVGKRLIEPSGTRADRPGLRRLLEDGAADRFDVIVAWKEDRLYRSYRAMLDVLDCIEQHPVTVELVMETFDAAIAPVKAWAARMELKAKSERTAMGRAARLAAGKLHPGFVPFGYRREGDAAVLHAPEAEWVERIYDWYVSGVAVGEIRRRLIASGAPQRGATSFGKGARAVPWAKGVIQKILHNPVYSTGQMTVTMANGRRFDLTLPRLVPASMERATQERRQRNQTTHLRNVKHDYLAAGLAYCEKCNVKLSSKVRYRKHGPALAYCCPYHNTGYVSGAASGCCRTLAAPKVDEEVWRETWRLLSDDAYFESRVSQKVAYMRTTEAAAQTEVDALEQALDDIIEQRQWVITQARTKTITAQDMAMQLAALDIEEAGKRRQLSEKSLLVGNRAAGLVEFANRYRAQLRRGADFLTAAPTSPEMAAEQFKLRRTIVEAVVTRVEVDGNKKVWVDFLLSPADEAAGLDNSRLREFIGPHPTLLANWSWQNLRVKD